MKRRNFIGKTAAGMATLTIVPRHVLGGTGFIAPSDKINLGYIGLGKQSYHLVKEITKCQEAVTVAASDVYGKKLDLFLGFAKEQNAKKDINSEIKAYHYYREMLERPDIDAVVIVSPDHWHAQMVVDAAKAGKDIYCEKPMALTVAEGRAMVNATRKYDRVFQTGNMQRSWRDFRHAVELVRNGYIGEIIEINVSVGEPVRQCDLPTQELPESLDWNEWVGPSLFRGYHEDLAPKEVDGPWAWWRGYRDFGGGLITDWGAHMFDIVQWALDMDESGPVQFIPPDGYARQTGMTIIYNNGVRVTHKLASANLKKSDQRVYFSDNHYQDWIDAIKKRNKPVSDVETGHRTASVCNLVNICYELERPLLWDPENEKFIGDAWADMMLSRPYRGKWDFTDY